VGREDQDIDFRVREKMQRIECKTTAMPIQEQQESLISELGRQCESVEMQLFNQVMIVEQKRTLVHPAGFCRNEGRVTGFGNCAHRRKVWHPRRMFFERLQTFRNDNFHPLAGSDMSIIAVKNHALWTLREIGKAIEENLNGFCVTGPVSLVVDRVGIC
jgi:hypothetical protein